MSCMYKPTSTNDTVKTYIFKVASNKSSIVSDSNFTVVYVVAVDFDTQFSIGVLVVEFDFTRVR